MKRGDLLTAAFPGDYGKPRPAVVVQNDLADGTLSILLCMLTSELAPSHAYRVPIPMNERTGLTKPSEIMADKATMLARDKCGAVFGKAPPEVMLELDMAFTFILGLGS